MCVETRARSARATTGGGNPRNVTHPVDGVTGIVYIVFVYEYRGRWEGGADRWRISGGQYVSPHCVCAALSQWGFGNI